jgi:hypothetical protein
MMPVRAFAAFKSWLMSGRSDAQRGTAAGTWVARTAALVTKLRYVAPYAAIELILPGGSMMALLLWLYRRQKRSALASD